MLSAKMSWKPDESLFELVDGVPKGLRLVREVLEKAELDLNQVITSRHPALVVLQNDLRLTTVPKGFEQHHVPVLLEGRDALFFITTGEPNAEFPEHRHHSNDGLRVVISGSILFNETELRQGDWMFVPRGVSYSFRVGPQGCTLFHGYPQNPPG